MPALAEWVVLEPLGMQLLDGCAAIELADHAFGRRVESFADLLQGQPP